MNLIVDVGNTAVKIGVFLANELIEKRVCVLEQFCLEIEKIDLQYFQIKKAIISSVADLKSKELSMLKEKWDVLELNAKTLMPFKNLYKTPETLGVDRLAVIAAAVEKYPSKNVLIVDAGTCITYEFKNQNEEYLGGAIAPGIQMRYNGLHKFTAKLPLLTRENSHDMIGTTTEEAIHSGIINGVLHEIDGVISYYCNTYSDLTVILTGGDAHFLSKRLKNSIFAAPDFLLEGLNHILAFNNNK
ncbi:type III pantothenate kinase [Aquimarina rhabdastrellae]